MSGFFFPGSSGSSSELDSLSQRSFSTSSIRRREWANTAWSFCQCSFRSSNRQTRYHLHWWSGYNVPSSGLQVAVVIIILSALSCAPFLLLCMLRLSLSVMPYGTLCVNSSLYLQSFIVAWNEYCHSIFFVFFIAFHRRQQETRLVAQLLTLMDGIGSSRGSSSNPSRVVVVAATNRYAYICHLEYTPCALFIF